MIRPLLLSVFLASAATLLFELALTRLLSVTTWYHFAFAVISAALLGLGAGASWVGLAPRWFPRGREREQIGFVCALGGIATAVALAVVVAVPFAVRRNPMSILIDVGYVVSALVPFAATGVVLALALRAARDRAAVVYGVDLLGAAVGAALFVPAASGLGAPGACLAAAGLFAVAGAIATPPGRSRRLPWIVLVASLVAMVATPQRLLKRIERGKGRQPVGIAQSYWNAYSYVTVADPGYDKPFGWGFGTGLIPPTAPKQLGLTIDLMAATVLTEFHGDLATVDYLRQDVTHAVHSLRPGGRSLIIGVGGGRDVLAALNGGAREVVGLEINASILDLLTDRYREFAGLAARSDVTLVNDEARSYLTRHPELRFDVIQASLVDTWAASASGAFALTENGLYTTEAWVTFLERLADDGILTMSRWHGDGAPELLRMVSLAVAALEQLGVDEPARHIALIRTARVGTILVRRSPFTAADGAILDRICEDRGFERMFVPGGPAVESLEALTAGAEGWRQRLPDSDWDLTPPTDDRPFFFYLTKPADWLRPARLLGVSDGHLRVDHTDPLHVLLAILLASAVAAVGFLVLPPYLVARRSSRHSGERRPPAAALLYMAAIGLAFMLVEVPVLTRLAIVLGHPVLSLVVVLSGILVASGVGSMLCGTLAPDLRRRIVLALGPMVVLLALGMDLIAPVLAALPGPGRIAGSALLVVLAGLPLGVPLPAGLLRTDPDGAASPILFGINGAFSVLGSVVAMIGLLNYGTRVTLVVGAVLYLVAGLLLGRIATMGRGSDAT